MQTVQKRRRGRPRGKQQPNIIAIVRDETVGDKRHVVAICVDIYCLSIFEGSDLDNLKGKKWFLNLDQISRGLLRDFPEVDIESARKKVLDYFCQRTGDYAEDLSWKEMDAHFHPGKTAADSTGKLQLYVDLSGNKDEED